MIFWQAPMQSSAREDLPDPHQDDGTDLPAVRSSLIPVANR
jgi:hypothetical protein